MKLADRVKAIEKKLPEDSTLDLSLLTVEELETLQKIGRAHDERKKERDRKN